MVGQWPAGAAQLRSVPDAILDLIEDKVADLDDLKARVEGRLFRLTLTSPRTGERVTPASSYTEWLVVSLFRHWLAENLTPQPLVPPKAPPPSSSRHHGGPSHHQQQPPPPPSPLAQATASSRPFRLLGTSGPAYLGHDEVKKFVKQARSEEYSREGLRRFERKLDELKASAREVVRPLMRNYLEMESVGGEGGRRGEGGGNGGGVMGLGYLTCTRVEEGDYPW